VALDVSIPSINPMVGIPISASMRSVFLAKPAIAAPMFIATVVEPVPPFPEIVVYTFAVIEHPLKRLILYPYVLAE
jgi:hypothetical protein